MLLTLHRSCLAAALAAALPSQSVLTVGPTGQFADLPAAVAAARPGDTVRCLENPPFQVFTAPTITSGITVDGAGVHQFSGRMTISGLAAHQRAVVRGFVSTTPFDLFVTDCAGRVHIDLLSTTTNASPGYSTSIQIVRSAAVTMHHVSTYGSPALRVVDSTVTLDHCNLGTSAGGNRAIGRSLDALRSTVLVSQPNFRVGSVAFSAIYVDGCALTVTGRAQSTGPGTVEGGSFGGTQALAIEGTASTVTLSPMVAARGGIDPRLSVTLRDSPYQRVQRARIGSSAALESFGTAGAVGVAVLTEMVAPSPSPFASIPGTIWVDLSAPGYYLFTLDTQGQHYRNLLVPALPIGSAWTLQSAIATGGQLELALPTTFTVTR